MPDQPPVNRAARQALAIGAGMVVALVIALLAIHLGHSPPN